MNRNRIIILAIGFGVLVCSSYSEGPFYYGAGNRTGTAGSAVGCSSNSTCHSATNLSSVLNIQLVDSLGNSVTNYIPGHSYRIQLHVIAPGTTRTHFGFQASIVKASDGSTQAGTLSVGGTANIAVYNAPPQLVEHTQPLSGVAAGGNYLDTVSFKWTAPASGFGNVRVFAVLNAVNFNGTSTGDAWLSATADYAPQIPNNVTSVPVPVWGIMPNPVQDRLHIESTEAYARIIVRDALGRETNQALTDAAGKALLNLSRLPAGMYFISLDTKEGLLSRAFQKE